MKRSAQRSLCAAILVLEGIVLFLTGVVMIGVTDLGTGRSLLIGGGLAALCLVAAGRLGRPGGYPLGWLVQAVSVALGLVVPVMFFVGAVFGVLWVTAYVLGARIDLERAERAVLEAEWQAQHDRASDA